MIELYGQEDKQCIHLNSNMVEKLKTVKDIHEDTQMDVIRFNNIPFEHLKQVHKHLNESIEWKPEHFIDLSSLANTVNFLNYNEMLEDIIGIFVSSIKLNSEANLRMIWNEESDWKEDEYEELIRKDNWCFQIPQIENSIIRKVNLI